MVASELQLRHPAPESDRFLSILTASESQRVLQVVNTLNDFPLSAGEVLWVVGTGSIARGNKFARDIDIAVWTNTDRKAGVVRHLEESFIQSGTAYQIDEASHMIGLPILLPKNQKLKTPTGRPIHLIIGEISGNKTEHFIDAFKSIPGLPLLEFFDKRG